MNESSMADDVRAIKLALLGDPFSGKVGILPQHAKIMEDFYGLDAHGNEIPSKKNTFAQRLSACEDTQKKGIWIFTGVVVGVTLLRSGITACIEKFWK